METRYPEDVAEFSSMAEMMESAAREAVRTARATYGFALDFQEDSLQALETILANEAANLDPSATEAIERAVKMWGAYFGQTVRVAFGGEWNLVTYPGKALSLPALTVRGSQLFPLLKVYPRITLGEPENVWTYYQAIRSRLAAVPSEEQPSA